MPHRAFTIPEAADYLHISEHDVERLVREKSIPHQVRGGRVVFHRGEIDAWASQRILGLPGKRLDAYHERSMRGTSQVFPGGALIPALLPPEAVDLALSSKTRASIVRDMVALAGRTGRVLDPQELISSIEEREALCPTAVPGGLAFLHARYHRAYRFEGSFLAIGRTIQPVPFSAPDGRPTQLFFLICCEDERIHLHTLARLCLLAQKTNAIDLLFDASDPNAAREALVNAEREVLPAVAKGGS